MRSAWISRRRKISPSIFIEPGQTFTLAARSDCFLFKRPSAEFAPDPALDPLWISYWEPFHGAIKKDFGFQVTLKVSDAP